MTDEEFDQIVTRLKNDGIETDQPMKEAHGWSIGEQARIIEDSGDSGIYAGDEGVVIPELVGSVRYGNVRTVLYFVPDGCDAGDEVDPDNLESI